MSSHHDHQTGLGSFGLLLACALALIALAGDLGIVEFLRALAAPIVALASYFH